MEGAGEGTGAGAGPSLRRASLAFFVDRLEERLRGVIPAFPEWRERLLAAHQLPTDWRATCIRQAVEEAIPLVSGDQGLELELHAWLQVIAENEVCALDFWWYCHNTAPCLMTFKTSIMCCGIKDSHGELCNNGNVQQ